MIRQELQQFLIGDPSIAAMVSGRFWPTASNDATEINKVDTPEAFDVQTGDILFSAMIVEDSVVRFGPFNEGSEIFVRVVSWQHYGRDLIDTFNKLVFRKLQGSKLQAVDGSYEFQWAGWSPSSLKDQGLRDAPMGWSRWQVPYIIK
jgi:hypothetical protein